MHSTKPIIEIKNIGKRYNITHQRGGYVSLRDVVMNILKSPFAFLKTKAKQAVGLEKKEDFWALRDVSFNVEKGEVVGIIGANGAGKSTLLKILSQITPPTEGEIILRGRVGSLLEVGTGFHPELTGRENIFLNGAILGMKKKEIESRFDAIVEFAGIGKFLDTPVKFYSSGMHVRLAFSVAAHMDPDILIIDEVLAVGDAEFQKKCLGKMDEITKTQGRTILFVSHNMSAVNNLCKRTILMEKGKIRKIGETREIVSEYINNQITTNKNTEYPADQNKKVKIRQVVILDQDQKPTQQVKVFETWSVQINYDVNEDISNIQGAVICTDMENNVIFISGEADNNLKVLKEKTAGNYTAIFNFPAGKISLAKGTYFLRVNVGIPAVKSLDQVFQIPLLVSDTESKFATIDGGNRKNLILLDNEWQQ